MSRLQVVGLYIAVGGAMPPAAVLLSEGEQRLFSDRERVCGRALALQATFGALCDFAFPANDGCLGYLMENALKDRLPFPEELAALASCIVLGKPIGQGKDYSEGGGLKVTAGSPVPQRPRPGGIAQKLPAQVQS